MSAITTRSIDISVGREVVSADLTVPSDAAGLVIFAHGSGSSRHSGRNRAVAGALNARRLATLLADLLTEREDTIDRFDGRYRFDIPLLGRRVTELVDWAGREPWLQAMPVGLFGASSGAAAALVAAAARPSDVRAVVSRGGRPDLAGDALLQVQAPTLLLVGGLDREVIDLNEWARVRMRCPVQLEIVPGATHLFEEPGTLAHVADAAARWLTRYLVPALGGAGRDHGSRPAPGAY